MITCIYDYISMNKCIKCIILMHEIVCYQWQSKGKGCIDKVHQEDRFNRDDQIIQVIILTKIIPLFLTILRRIMAIGGPTINPILHNITVSRITLIKDRRRSSHQLNHKHTLKLHAKPRRYPTRSSARSRN